jgi:5-aminopentanamidase
MKVASIQVKANDLKDYERAWEHLEQMVVNAANDHDLILVPECAFPAYFLHPDEGSIDDIVINNGDLYLNTLKEIARNKEVYIAYGCLEKSGEDVYNAAILIDPRGEEIVKKRKSFLWHFDQEWFTAGEDVAVADTIFGRVALVVCADARMPEIVRLAALEGAQLIIDLANLTATGPDITALQNAQSAYMLSVRAMENQVWLAVSDKWGVESGSITYAGRSGVFAPDGSIVYQASSHQDEVVSVEIPTDENGKIKHPANSAPIKRRPELYTPLTQENYALPVSEVMRESVIPEEITPYITTASGEFKDVQEYLQMVKRLVNHGSSIICMPPTAIQIADYVERITFYLPESVVLIGTVKVENKGMTSYFITQKGIEETYFTLHHEASLSEFTVPVFQTKWGRIGIMHGEEAILPEWPRTMMVLGADCIIWPNDLADSRASNIGRTRAAESRIFIVSASSCNQGVSQVIDPNGVVTASTLKNERIHACGSFAPFTLSRIKDVVPGTNVFRNRRPHFYGGLVK